MTPIGSEFEKFVKTVTKFMEQPEEHITFLGEQLRHTQIELYVLKDKLEELNDNKL